MRRALGPALALLAAVTLTVGGPAVAVGGDRPTTAPAAAAGEKVRASIDAKRNMTVPAAITPGYHVVTVTTVRKDGAMLHIAAPRAGYSMNQFVTDMNAGFNEGRPKALARLEANVDFLGGAWTTYGVKGTALVKVPADGKIWVLDSYPYTFTAARIRTVKVAGAPASETEVSGDATLTARPGRTWDAEPTTMPATGTLVLDNASTETVNLDLYRLKPGKTFADFDQWVTVERNGGDPGPMPIDGRHHTFVAGLSEGQRAAIRYSLKAGDYVVFSEWRAVEDGNFQFFSGLYRPITLTAG